MTDMAQTPEQETAVVGTLDLTQEQLTYLIRVMGLSIPFGFSMPKEEFDEATQQVIARTLVSANRIATDEKGAFSLNPALAVALTAVDNALGYMKIEPIYPARQPYWFYILDGAAVEHFQSGPGIETFRVAFDDGGFAAGIAEALVINADIQVPANPTVIRLPLDLFKEAMKLLKSDQRTDIAKLPGFPEAFARALLSSMATAAVSIVWPEGTDTAGDIFSVFVADSGHWLAQIDPDDSKQVITAPLSGNDVLDVIASRFNIFLSKKERA